MQNCQQPYFQFALKTNNIVMAARLKTQKCNASPKKVKGNKWRMKTNQKCADADEAEVRVGKSNLAGFVPMPCDVPVAPVRVQAAEEALALVDDHDSGHLDPLKWTSGDQKGDLLGQQRLSAWEATD